MLGDISSNTMRVAKEGLTGMVTYIERVSKLANKLFSDLRHALTVHSDLYVLMRLRYSIDQ